MVAGCALPARAQGSTVVLQQGSPAGSTAEAMDAAKPFAAWSEAVHTLRDSLVATARAQVGRKYVHGGESPERGFDCSGLIRYVMTRLDLALPRTAAQQARAGLRVLPDTARLRPGDLLTFGKGKRGPVSHIGIYVGNGRYVHASSVAGRVIESPLDRPASPLIKKWRGVRRIVADSIAIPLGAS
jgi:cell wall-associated NlpC family hydrolase